MEYRLEVFPEAEEAINEAVASLEKRSSGRGSDLLVAISEAIDVIVEFPKGSEKRYRSFRAKHLKNFPYLLIYEIIEEKDSTSNLIAVEDFVHQSSDWLPG